jgi:hypothetical protein
MFGVLGIKVSISRKTEAFAFMEMYLKSAPMMNCRGSGMVIHPTKFILYSD